MSEQQVVMKDCMWQSKYLTGGITDPQLREYLKMELGMKTPPNGYYKARRQMHIDHRIGGNPELTDQTAWIKTLAKNPALVKIYTQVEWANVAEKSGVASKDVVKNLKKAVQDRMASREKQRAQEKAETAKKRVEFLQGPRPVIAMIANGRSGSVAPHLETGKYLTLKGFKNCPPNPRHRSEECYTGLSIKYTVDTKYGPITFTKYIRYEENKLGYMRIAICKPRIYDWVQCDVLLGPWVKNGCSILPIIPIKERPFHLPIYEREVTAVVCADCQIVTADFPKDSTLRCVCPGY